MLEESFWKRGCKSSVWKVIGGLVRLRAMGSAGGGCMDRDLPEAVRHLESRVWGEWKERSCRVRCGSPT